MAIKMNETRVLLIDDQLINAELVDGMLAGEPSVVLAYEQHPVQVLDAASAFGPTVIMVDLHMPMVGGLEVIRTLKADPRVVGVPIIILSSYTSPQVKASGFEAGAIDFLVKWPDKVELTARLQAHSRAFCAIQERDRATAALRTSQAALFERTRELAKAQASLRRPKWYAAARSWHRRCWPSHAGSRWHRWP